MMVFKGSEIKSTVVGEGLERKMLANDGTMMAVEVHFKKGAVGTVHTHPHEQISYIISGSFEFELHGEKTILVAGDSYYVEPEASHGAVALEDSVILDIFTPQREDFK